MKVKDIIFGQPMPDKNDPKYRKRYERDFAAGEKFARKSGLSWLVMKIQVLANKHPARFLLISFGIVAACLGYNIGLLIRSLRSPDTDSVNKTPIEKVDSAVQHTQHYRQINYR